MTVRVGLLVLFGTILLSMLAITLRASLDRPVWAVGNQLLSDRWFQATLADAYFGFLTFYVWVAYRSRSWLSRLGWLVAILLLGNIAMATYMLAAVYRWRPEEGWAGLLLRPGQQGANA